MQNCFRYMDADAVEAYTHIMSIDDRFSDIKNRIFTQRSQGYGAHDSNGNLSGDTGVKPNDDRYVHVCDDGDGNVDVRSGRTVSMENDWLALFSALLFIAGFFLLMFASILPGFGEFYRTHVYVHLQGSIGRFTGAFPFSVAEVLCIVLPLMILYDLYDVYERKRSIWKFTKKLALLVILLFFLYEACCGVNYHSEPFVPAEVYSEASFTADQLKEFCEYTAGQLQVIYKGIESEDAHQDVIDNDGTRSDVGSGKDYPDWGEIANGAIGAMERLGEEYPQLSGYYPRPKRLTVLSRLFSMMGVSGIYSPFTIEANVNGEMEGLEKPFTACHELSHLRGYMNEGEANYIGWLACIGSDDEAFNRSGWLIAWIYAGRTLRQVDPERYEAIRSTVPEAALLEIRANDEFWRMHENKASEVQDRINDAYLKSNGIEEGIASYDQLTTLMLWRYFK